MTAAVRDRARHAAAAALLLFLSLPGPVTASHPLDDSENAYFEQLPVVLTASRLPQSLQDAPGAITVIERPLIERSGYRDLARLLRLVPGMHVGQERANASWVSYHGLGQSIPGELQILIDGAPTYVPVSFGTAAWTGLPVFLSEIERIEVVRGASANSYGASALQGAVNLITRPAAEDPGEHVSIVLGDPGVRDVEVGWAGGSAPLALRLTAGEQADEGFRDLHDHRRTQRFSVRGDAQIDPENSFSFRLGTTRETTGRGYPDSPFGNNALRDGADSAHLVHLRWQHVDDMDKEWSVSAYHHQLDYRDSWIGGAPGIPEVPLSRDRRDLRSSIEFQRRDRWSETVRGVWGAEATLTQTRSPFSFSSTDSVRVPIYRLFSNIEWQATAPTRLNLGLALERSNDEGWRFSPRLYANHRLTPADTLRLGAGRAWRTTSPFERHSDTRVYHPANPALLLARPFIPNPDLRQTRADTMELGYIRQLRWARSTAEIRVFQERLRDMVIRQQVTPPPPAPVLAASIPTTQEQNFGEDLNVRGIELQWQAHPWKGGDLRLAWSALERHAGNDQVEAAIAPYTASLMWMQRWPQRWSSMVHLTRVGPVATGDSYLAGEPYVVRAYTSLDIALSRTVRLAGYPARLTLTALNLGPRHQEAANPAQQIGRSQPANRVSRQVYLGLDMRF
ncbi:TonB-dependent receptor plug domain-containing protein [Denitromonas sp.]|uniref:TonB-dependent receptor plug domain-containing protein n=1 Tax=Denitromonas sp. TaxID=2734609 RepID=UPI002AFEB8F6|nr:TonB-dependent receptor [Denitromonas sp.]